MILERAEHPDWLSNAYLIASGPGGKGVLVDSNEVTEPLTDRVESDDIEVTHVLLTHHHWDQVVAAALAGSAAWHRDTQAAVTRLATNIGPMAFAPSLLNAVPPPVARYFRATLRDGQPMIRSAVATQDAEFFINGAWRPLTATQHFRASPPAFIWDARIQMAPLLPALVRDAYADGQGAMKASMLGVFTLAHRAGLRELNLGALQRFLGEAIWLPTALLPGDAVSWTAKDDHSATATLRDRGLEVSLLFEFDDEDMVRLNQAMTVFLGMAVTPRAGRGKQP